MNALGQLSSDWIVGIAIVGLVALLPLHKIRVRRVWGKR